MKMRYDEGETSEFRRKEEKNTRERKREDMAPGAQRERERKRGRGIRHCELLERVGG